MARRLVAAVFVAALAVLLPAWPASAHVTVDSPGAKPGADDVVLTFRVPNERTGARTVKVDITFPSRTPIAAVRPAAKAGWTVTTRRVTFASPIRTDDGDLTEGVGQVVFTATAGGIPEGAFDTFQVLAGPIPKGVTSLAFPTVQAYSDGSTSAWIEPAVEGTEPAHPAPVLQLVDGPLSPRSGDAVTVAGGGPPVPTDAQVAAQTAAGTAQLIALVGLGIGLSGVVVAFWALWAARRAGTLAASSLGRVDDHGAVAQQVRAADS